MPFGQLNSVPALKLAPASLCSIKGKILGGDAQYFYVGSYRLEGAIAKATFTIQHYAGAAHTVFGDAQQLVIEVSGKPAQDSFELRGHVLGAPKATLTVRLQRRAELQ